MRDILVLFVHVIVTVCDLQGLVDSGPSLLNLRWCDINC